VALGGVVMMLQLGLGLGGAGDALVRWIVRLQ
jgi:hypothetical protein